MTRVRDALGRIQSNIGKEKTVTPYKVGVTIRKKIQELLLSNAYVGAKSARKGPYRRKTNKGLADNIAVQKIGNAMVQVRPVGVPETYALPLEEGHNSPINGPVEGKHYFRTGVRLADADIKKEVKESAKRIIGR